MPDLQELGGLEDEPRAAAVAMLPIYLASLQSQLVSDLLCASRGAQAGSLVGHAGSQDGGKLLCLCCDLAARTALVGRHSVQAELWYCAPPFYLLSYRSVPPVTW